MIKGFQCEIDPRPISEWVNKEVEGDECPPCLIAPLASYYLGALKDAGETKIANHLKEVFEKGDLLTICKELDNIKTNVGESLRKELLELDCFAQSEKFI